MGQVFSTLNQWLAGSLWFAALGSLLWGIFSIVLSPCHLATIPLIIGYISSKEDQTSKKAFASSLLLSLGILTSIVLLGAITVSLGRIAGDLGSFEDYLLAGVFFFFGLYLTGFIKLNWGGLFSTQGFKKNHDPWSTFLLGIVVGAGLGPCTFAFMAPVLGIAFQLANTHLYKAVLMLTLFALGHVGVIILAGTFTGAVQNYLNWTEKSKGALVVKFICGILLILYGVYTLYKKPILLWFSQV